MVEKQRGLNVHYLATGTSGEARVLLTLFIMLLAAKLMAELFERLRQPAVAGEILAGVPNGNCLAHEQLPSFNTNSKFAYF